MAFTGSGGGRGRGAEGRGDRAQSRPKVLRVSGSGHTVEGPFWRAESAWESLGGPGIFAVLSACEIGCLKPPSSIWPLPETLSTSVRPWGAVDSCGWAPEKRSFRGHCALPCRPTGGALPPLCASRIRQNTECHGFGGPFQAHRRCASAWLSHPPPHPGPGLSGCLQVLFPIRICVFKKPVQLVWSFSAPAM